MKVLLEHCSGISLLKQQPTIVTSVISTKSWQNTLLEGKFWMFQQIPAKTLLKNIKGIVSTKFVRQMFYQSPVRTSWHQIMFQQIVAGTANDNSC